MLFLPPALIAQDLPNEAYVRKQRDTWLNVAQNSKHDVEAWHKVAEFELQLGNPDAAIAAEDKAIAMFPKYAVAYATRARAHFDERNFPAARADASKVIELMEARGGFQKYIDFERPPEHYIASYRLRGLTYAWESNWDPAFKDLAAAVKLSPNDVTLEVERAALYEKAKRPKDAVSSRLRAGLLYADANMKGKAMEQAAALKKLGAAKEAGQIEAKLVSKKPKSDLPD
jgi:tetratricopeptide (TPR) repeat protein